MKITPLLIAGVLIITQQQTCHKSGKSGQSQGIANADSAWNISDSIKFPALPAQLYTVAGNVWNTPVDQADIDPNNATIIKNVQLGISENQQGVIVDLSVPYYVVDNPARPVTIRGITGNEGADGNYGVPEDTIKFPELSDKKPQTSDPHLLIYDKGLQRLYELYNANTAQPGSENWLHHGAAIFNLSDTLPSRQDGYTSADAAGLPILPGLLRFEELRSGEIKHALRVTMVNGQVVNSYVSPATHNPVTGNPYDSTKALQFLPMGSRLRLKSSFVDTIFPAEARTIIKCLKKYGLIVADIGPHFNISGTNDPRFNRQYSGYSTYREGMTLNLIANDGVTAIPWSSFEVIKMGKPSAKVLQYP